jgi:hypothetical protein
MINHFQVDLISDIAGLIGGIVLVKPALRANGLAKHRFKLESIPLTEKDHEVIHELRHQASERIGKKIFSWEKTDEWAVLGGLLLVIFSFGIKIIWALAMGPDAH